MKYPCEPWVEKIKDQTRRITRKAVKFGILIPNDCEVCGNAAQPHHTDYTRPLDVLWLCSEHHGMWHSEYGRFMNSPSIPIKNYDQLMEAKRK